MNGGVNDMDTMLDDHQLASVTVSDQQSYDIINVPIIVTSGQGQRPLCIFLMGMQST